MDLSDLPHLACVKNLKIEETTIIPSQMRAQVYCVNVHVSLLSQIQTIRRFGQTALACEDQDDVH